MIKNSINKVFILGRLGQNPVLKYTKNGTPYLKITVATNETWKDKNDQIITKTEWHKIAIYNTLAEFIANFTLKGSLIFIEGAIKTNSWTTDTETKNITEIVASNIQIIDNKKNQTNNENTNQKDDIEDDFVTFDNKTPF